MNKKRLALLLLIILLLTGCNKAKEITSKKTSIEGSEGVIFEFYRNTPAKEVFELQSLPLAFRIQNVGACDLSPEDSKTNPLTSPNRCTASGKALFSLSWDDQVIGIPWESTIRRMVAESNDEDYTYSIRCLPDGGGPECGSGRSALALFLLGRDTVPGPAGSTSVTEGEERLLVLDAQARGINNLDPNFSEQKAQITAGLCYPYKTQVVTEVCIDPDLFNLQEKEKTCEVILDKDLKTQGAPVAITHMKTDMLPSNVHMTIPRFEFTIKNLGKGKVIDFGALHRACSFEVLDKIKDENVLTFKASLVGRNMPLYCGNNTLKKEQEEVEIRLDREKQQVTVICETKPLEQDEGTFDTPLLIEVKYAYFDKQTEEVKINRVRKLTRS